MSTIKQIKINKKLKILVTKNQYPTFECNYEDETSDINLAINQLDIYKDVNNDIIVRTSTFAKSISFSVNILPFCCGILEIGEIRCDEGIDSKILISILDGIVTKVKGKTLIINTNGLPDSLEFEKVLPKCKNWVLVKTFKNDGENTIKMWVSNND